MDPKHKARHYVVRDGSLLRVYRGVTTLRDRGFRTFHNCRDTVANVHDERLLDLSSFVNHLVPGASESPILAHLLSDRKVPIPHEVEVSPSWDLLA